MKITNIKTVLMVDGYENSISPINIILISLIFILEALHDITKF